MADEPAFDGDKADYDAALGGLGFHLDVFVAAGGVKLIDCASNGVEIQRIAGLHRLGPGEVDRIQRLLRGRILYFHDPPAGERCWRLSLEANNPQQRRDGAPPNQ